MNTSTITAEDLRVAIARSRLPKYIIGAHARVHPVVLSRLINGREPIRPDVGERILQAIEELTNDLSACKEKGK